MILIIFKESDGLIAERIGQVLLFMYFLSHFQNGGLAVSPGIPLMLATKGLVLVIDDMAPVFFCGIE